MLLTHRTLIFFPFLPSPLPGSCRCPAVPGSRRGCGAAVRAWLRCLPRAGQTGARPSSVPGAASAAAAGPARRRRDKSSAALSQLQPPKKPQPLVSPMWSPRGADTPRLRSRCDTVQVKWHRWPAVPEPPRPLGATAEQGWAAGKTATSSCHHHHSRGKTRWV